MSRLLEFLQGFGEDEAAMGDDDKGMVNEAEGVQSLGGREMSSSMRDEICVCVVVAMVAVAVVVALMVVMGVVVLMVPVGVVVFVIVLRILCIGVVEEVGVLCIGVMEVGCAGVVDILVLGGVWLKE